MGISYVAYNLKDGFVNHWLAAGPQVIPIKDLDAATGRNLKEQVIKKYYQKRSGITKDPVERGPLTEGLFTIGEYEGSWSYYRCQDDHFVDHSAGYQQPGYLRSWAYTQLVTQVAQEAIFILTTNGPADLWLDNRHIHRQEHLQNPFPKSVEFKVMLKEGRNPILIRFEAVNSSECQDVMALRICQSADPDTNGAGSLISGIHIEIPTLIEDINRRNELEESFETVYMRRDVFFQDEKIEICWPEGLEKEVQSDVRLQAVGGLTYAQAEVDGKPGDVLFLGYGGQLHTGQYKAFLTPRHWEYFNKDLRITKDIPFWVIGNDRFSPAMDKTFPERRQAALIHAAAFEGSLYAEMAKMALGRWDAIVPGVIRNTVMKIKERNPGNLLLLAGILRMFESFSSHPEFQRGLKKDIKDCILSFKYGSHDPGRESINFEKESTQILLHACEILAGQKYPDLEFGDDNQTGRWHCSHGEKLAREWLEKRSSRGFRDWNSPQSFEEILVALALLADFTDDDLVGSLAMVLMDKLFFALALNSFQGVVASSQGRVNSSEVRGGYLQPTSGITRLMWGMGIYNQHLAGLVNLACSRGYELPLIFIDIAKATPEALWSREKHAVDTPGRPRIANLSSYRTPDGMLSSAQDYYPGEPGEAEHIWQATLGPGATVYVNHPANSSCEDHILPNFWVGNKILPRVAQWNDTLLAAYLMPEDDWMGFTHAYFPTFAFDEYTLRDSWAFARKGNGYLALTASNGVQLTRIGKEAYREIRSPGTRNTWICQLGRAVHDQDFTNFQEKILATRPVFEGVSVRMTSLRGEALSFGWGSPFKLNGEEISFEGQKHYDSLFGQADFPARQLEIQFGDDLLRLDLSSPQEGGNLS